MGYKLAGCDVIGGVDIDPKMVRLYRRNLRPRISYCSDVRSAPTPDAQVDILDGSPPCTPFSTAGNREKDWGKLKRFNEGASAQQLDDLFFHFIAYAERVRPRVIVAENVVGLLKGNARAYVRRIGEAFKAIGYSAQLFRLSAAHFGVPQSRERVFFVAQPSTKARRLVLAPETQRVITIREALADIDAIGPRAQARDVERWQQVPRGRNLRFSGSGRFGVMRLNPDATANTITAAGALMHWSEPHYLSPLAYARLQSFPDDYDYGTAKPVYVIGMSVPPLMMRGIARQLIEQVF